VTDPDHLADLDRRHLWHPFTAQQRWVDEEPLIITRGEGCWLIDARGRRYLDGVSSLWTNVHGHGHPALDAALRRQIDALAHSTLLGLTHPTAITLAARLVGIAPAGLTRVFYSDSGSTAAEVAVKMAFQAQQHWGQPQRTRFATLRDAYHGDTLGAVSVGAIDVFHQIFRPLLFDTVALPAPVSPAGDEERDCLERALALLDAHGDTLAALVVEPLVQGAGGMKMHSPGFVAALIDRARAHGALVIADEVAVGFGRTGTMFAMAQVERTPDLLCLAKGISGGYLPLAATLATERVYAAFLGAPEDNRQFFHGHTYTGNPLACAVALASLDVFEAEGTLARAAALADSLRADLAARVAPHPRVAAIRQRGTMIGVDLRSLGGGPAPFGAGYALCRAARDFGAILRPLGNTLVINPPLALSPAEGALLIDAVVGALDATGGAP
jgi:adenosylmethionine---8-amino-7-oxononanoate aminotransferase